MRKITNINSGWLFSKKVDFPQRIDPSCMKRIEIPHTWNAVDGQDGNNDYYRGECVYYKNLGRIDALDDEIYLEFNGANMILTAFVNNHLVGSHKGGYSRFRFNITKHLLKDSDNVLVCYVDNSPSLEVYPQKADFTFYGGIYRDVNLITVKRSHFDLNHFGGNGVKITPCVSGNVDVELYAEGSEGEEVTVQIYDQDRNVVAKESGTVLSDRVHLTLKVDDVHLWDGLNDPYLYGLKASMKDDEITDHFGFRSFEVNPEKGFFLNGKPYDLIGVSMHQDREGAGTALTEKMHDEDFALIREIGATTIRLAHYQHNQYVYDLADRYGIIIWAEIPYISEHMDGAVENTRSQLKELIVQNYNHPSIVVWGLSNEITVTQGFTEAIYDNHVYLNDLAHKLDGTRLTTMANLFLLETSSPLVSLPDVRSYNLYYGWYTGKMEDNDKWFDDFHKDYPGMAIGLSEYGVDANIRFQSSNPSKGDYSETYQALYHEHMLKMREGRPWIWAMHVWNMFDFAADARDEGGKKGINQKGLVTFDRKTRKDAFYIYKAYLSKEPFVHLCGKRYIERNESVTIVKVYSNMTPVSLYVDDVLIETKDGNKAFEFSVPLNGIHQIRAVSGNQQDDMTIKRVFEDNREYMCETRLDVVNWFEETEGIDKNYFSIKDRVIDIKNHPVAGAVYGKMMNEIMKSIGDVSKNYVLPKEMQERMDNMSLEENLKMAGHMVNPEAVGRMNKMLQEIRK